jgi:predicted oxidoreductase
MKTQTIGTSAITASRMSYGCMRIAGTWNPAEITPEREAAGIRAIMAAYEAGFTLFDHADIYCRGGSETIFGKALRQTPGLREKIIIATKCGIRFPGDPQPESPHRYDFSAEHILTSCDASLQRMGIETIDIYQLHRPDLLMDPAEIAQAFAKLHQAGKVRYFGVSNFVPSFVETLQRALPMKLVVNQVQISLADLHCFYDGTLDQCLRENITPLAWSPVAGGWLGKGGTIKADDPRHDKKQALLDLLDKTAADHHVTRTAIALAWLMKHPSQIVPIIGSCNPEHIREAAAADNVTLSREEWYRLLVAGRGEKLP